MPDRVDIEHALDALIADEGGMKFQGLAVVLAKLRWPDLVARERKNDLGLDAYASARLSRDGIGKGLACSIAATLGKVKDDAQRAKNNHDDITALIFATPIKVPAAKAKEWATEIASEFGYELTVISREDIITDLQVPANASICRAHLGITVPYEPSTAELIENVRAAAAVVAAAWAAHPRLAGKPRLYLNALNAAGP
jgi:hypothetical protein